MMTFCKTFAALFFFLATPLMAWAITPPQREEILLTFRHPAIGHVYVNCIYDQALDKYYLPINEIFSLLEINYKTDVKNLTVKGNVIAPGIIYSVNLLAGHIRVGEQTFTLKAEDFFIGEMDFYFTPEIFETAFGLNFTVNLLSLSLTLETAKTLPIEERLIREKNRSKMEGFQSQTTNFPLGYERKFNVLRGGMVDYSLSSNFTGVDNGFGYTVAGGMELLGGDFQANIIGNYNLSGTKSHEINGLRWRYAVPNNDYFSGIMAGQIATTGLHTIPIRGIAITNDPIEPRRMFETYALDGTTIPESEVEIYLNDRLTDFKRADELGYFRFDVPVTYGTTRVNLRIYTPTGEIIFLDRHLQVPFTFLPKGIFSYNIQGGQLEQNTFDTTGNQSIVHGNLAYGINRYFTVSAGAQQLYGEQQNENMFLYGSLAARIARQYLMNLDVAPGNFLRLSGNVMYANNLSLNLVATKFEGIGSFNARSLTEEYSANVFFPFTIFGLNTGIRLGGERLVSNNKAANLYRTDFNAHLEK